MAYPNGTRVSRTIAAEQCEEGREDGNHVAGLEPQVARWRLMGLRPNSEMDHGLQLGCGNASSPMRQIFSERTRRVTTKRSQPATDGKRDGQKTRDPHADQCVANTAGAVTIVDQLAAGGCGATRKEAAAAWERTGADLHERGPCLENARRAEAKENLSGRSHGRIHKEREQNPALK